MKHLFFRCGLIALLGMACLKGVAQTPTALATGADVASLERVAPDGRLTDAMEDYLRGGKGTEP